MICIQELVFLLHFQEEIIDMMWKELWLSLSQKHLKTKLLVGEVKDVTKVLCELTFKLLLMHRHEAKSDFPSPLPLAPGSSIM